MNSTKKIFKNMLVLIIAQLATAVFGFLYIIYAARYLGSTQFGILSLVLAITTIFGIFIDMGLNTTMTREISRNRRLSDKYIFNVIIIKLLLSIIVIILLYVLINLFSYGEKTGGVVLYLIMVSTVLTSLSNTFFSIFQAYEKMEHQSLGTIINSLLLFILTMLAINQKYDTTFFALIYVISSSIVLTYCICIYYKHYYVFTEKLDATFLLSTLKQSIPVGFGLFFITIYYWIDTIMISYMLPNSQNVIGWYNASYRLVMILVNLPSLYVLAIFPLMSRLYLSSDGALKLIIERSTKMILLFSIPIVVGTLILSNSIILLIYGSDYSSSSLILQILIWSFLFASIGSIFGNLLNSTNKQNVLTKIVGCGVILNITLNIVFIPIYGYIGASITSDLTRMLVIVLELYVLLKMGYKFNNSSFITSILKIILSSIVMGIFIILFININLFLLIGLSIMVYFITLFAVKFFNKEDISMIKDIIKGVPSK